MTKCTKKIKLWQYLTSRIDDFNDNMIFLFYIKLSIILEREKINKIKRNKNNNLKKKNHGDLIR